MSFPNGHLQRVCVCESEREREMYGVQLLQDYIHVCRKLKAKRDLLCSEIETVQVSARFNSTLHVLYCRPLEQTKWRTV